MSPNTLASRTRQSLVPAALVALGALALACSGANAEGKTGMLGVGSAAPDITGRDAAGKAVTLSQQKGHPAVVYFYPKDETPGCTKEACAFRDVFQRFVDAGVVIFGVSRDSEKSHDEFRKQHSLPFPLVADESGAVQKSYGVPSKFGTMAARVTFLIDAKGKIAKVWPDVDPGVHADEVLKAIAALPKS